MTGARWVLLAVLLALAGCGPYQPGRSGMGRPLPQNEPSNAEPQPRGSLPP